MNRRAFYTYSTGRPNKVYGPFVDRRHADDYAAARGHSVCDLSCNEINNNRRIRVAAAYGAAGFAAGALAGYP